MKYRADIDGLRAIAVLPVVLYHAGISWFSGGYVGVDVFFVISGFLITSIIAEEIRQNKFSILHFYERRIRRIFPALFTVFTFTVAGAALLFLPPDYKDFSQSLIAATLFASNFLFWQESGYFAGPAEEKPLLHTWSLAVEEQYYIFFPIMLFIIWRLMGGRFLLWLVPLGLLSFGASIWGVENKPTATFYLLHTRAWELFLGGALALGAFPMLENKPLKEVLGWSGLAMIFCSVFLYTAQTPFPGLAALLPCLGATLIIYAQGTKLGQFLSLKPIVFTGLLSYSLYLWHWPIIVFAKYYLMRELHAPEIAGVIAASFILSYLSWRFIEAPFRGKNGILTRGQIFLLAALAMGAMIVIGGIGHITKGLPQRLPAEVAEMSSKAYEERVLANPDRHQCLGSVDKNKTEIDDIKNGKLCTLGIEGTPSLLLWGDSHAEALRSGVDEAAKQLGIAGVFAGYTGCPPALNIVRYDEPANQCAAFNKAVFDYILDHNIKTVILYARWALYVEGTHYKQETGKDIHLQPGTKTQNTTIIQKNLEQTIQALKKNGVRILTFSATPEIGIDVTNAMAKNIYYKHNFDLNDVVSPTREEFNTRNENTKRILRNIAEVTGAVLYETDIVLCDTKRCKVIDEDATPIYRDDDHLSRYGALKLTPQIAKALSAFLSSP